MFCICACMDRVCMRVKCLKALHVCAWSGRGSEQSLPDTLSDPPTPPHLPPCDGLSWMLMFCDGCGANKCFWHSTGSHYRSRPNGLASALMSRQVSQPQPLYQSHILLMQGANLSTPRPDPGKEKKHWLPSPTLDLSFTDIFLSLELWSYLDAGKVLWLNVKWNQLKIIFREI